MILFFTSIILFNFITFTFAKRLTGNQISHIWTFTISFQLIFDLLIEHKFLGYWYFDKDVELFDLLAHFFLIPPVNIIFLNWFPTKSTFFKQIIYISAWTCFTLIYEYMATLPKPFGFFHLGWWRVWYDIFVVPILFLILLGYFKYVLILEKRLLNRKYT